MRNFLRTLLIGLGIFLAPWAARAAGLDSYKGAARAIALGAMSGVELAGKVIEQKARAEENVKKLFGSEAVPFLETEHFLIHGKVPGRSPAAVGASLEKQYELARKVLKLEAADPWPGKLAVYFFLKRREYASFVRGVEKRRPESDDYGSFEVRSDFPHIAAGPPGDEATSAVLELQKLQMADQLAGALITLKAGKSIPFWIHTGFGRATYYHAAGPKEYTAERKRASRALATTGKTAMDVWTGEIKGSNGVLLTGSLVDYLAYGPGRARFLAILEGFKIEEGAGGKTTEDAMKAASVVPAVVNRKWKLWARGTR